MAAGFAIPSPFIWALLAALCATSVKFIVPVAQTYAREAQTPPAAQLQTMSWPCDFLEFWAAARLATAGQASEAYTPAKLYKVENPSGLADGPALTWLNLPVDIPLALPLQNLSFFHALVLWNATLLILSAFLLARAGLPAVVILATLASPASLLNLAYAQTALLIGAISAAGFLAAQRHPRAAGALFGLLILKPQAATLAPLICLAQRNFGVFAAGLGTLAAACASATSFTGVDAWREFFTTGLATAHDYLVTAEPDGGISVFWLLRACGLNVSGAMLGQAAAALAALWAGWRAWRVPNANPVARMALSQALTLLITPYGFLYDLCGCSAGAAALVWQEKRLTFIDMALFTAPVTMLIAGDQLHLPLTPVILVLFAWRAARALHVQDCNIMRG